MYEQNKEGLDRIAFIDACNDDEVNERGNMIITKTFVSPDVSACEYGSWWVVIRLASGNRTSEYIENTPEAIEEYDKFLEFAKSATEGEILCRFQDLVEDYWD